VASALDDTAREVEQRYDVRIETVVVGDAPVDDTLAALCAAVREACVNAAKHSGSTQISLYAEIGEEQAEAFVRDRGKGFDRAVAGVDRRGIAGSIEGRIAAVGGVAVVESSPDAGTEVRITVPRVPRGDGTMAP
jgi:signal transduction histidine kinase